MCLLMCADPGDFNKKIPTNLLLVCGDYLLEILSEAIRQASQLAVPVDAWKQVLSWIKDLTSALRKRSGNRDALFILDCNPSFAIYTQLALALQLKILLCLLHLMTVRVELWRTLWHSFMVKL